MASELVLLPHHFSQAFFASFVQQICDALYIILQLIPWKLKKFSLLSKNGEEQQTMETPSHSSRAQYPAFSFFS